MVQPTWMPAVDRLDLLDGRVVRGDDGLGGLVVGGRQSGGREAVVALLGLARHHGDHVRLIDGADVADALADHRCAGRDVAGEELDRAVGGPAAARLEPLRHGEVVQGDHGAQAALDGALDHAAVVGEFGPGELALGRFDPRPLDGEPVVGEAQTGQRVHVLVPAVVAVARVQAGLLDVGARGVLLDPPVAVGVVALDLVGGRGGAPQEAFGERDLGVSHRKLSFW